MTTMTAQTASPARSVLHALAAFLRAVGSTLALLADTNRRIEAVERLSRLSDAELAARGTTRGEQIQRIMSIDAAR